MMHVRLDARAFAKARYMSRLVLLNLDVVASSHSFEVLLVSKVCLLGVFLRSASKLQLWTAGTTQRCLPAM